LSKEIVIVSPHPDDEIIGNYEVLTKADKSILIVYDADVYLERREETKKIRDIFPNVKAQAFQTTIPQPFLQKSNTFYVPDPYFETHPIHRRWGFLGEQLARQGFDVIFYSTIMNTPYIREVEFSNLKESALNNIYPSQETLWKYDNKYFLFEGHCKWIF